MRSHLIWQDSWQVRIKSNDHSHKKKLKKFMKYLEKSTFNHYVSYKIFTLWRHSDYTQLILYISSYMHGRRGFDHMRLS